MLAPLHSGQYTFTMDNIITTTLHFQKPIATAASVALLNTYAPYPVWSQAKLLVLLGEQLSPMSALNLRLAVIPKFELQ